ncbi:MAG: flagellar motor switch protein FliG [Pyrinomonadaceae bacterium]
MTPSPETIVTDEAGENPDLLTEGGEETNSALAVRQQEGLSGARKAAILCLSLGEEAASVLFKYLDEEEVQILSRELAMLPDVKSDISDEIVDEFNQLLLARSYVTTGGVDYAKRLLNRSFGAEVAKRLTDKVVHSLESPASFEALQKTDPQQLAKLFQSEHPQTIAVVLAHLDPSTAADVLGHLPETSRADIILRLAGLQTVSQDIVKRISHVLNQKLVSVQGMSRATVGGIRSVAEICNRLDRESMRMMMEQIEENNQDLSLEIRNLMVTFEDILLVDDIGIREIMQRVDKKVLALALKGTVEELQDRFFSNMSNRAVEMMKEEMDFMGQVKLKEVNGAQREIVEILRELDEQGVISLGGAGGGEDEYVS